MGKGGGDAPSPDPQIGAAALKQATTGEAWLKFATDQAAVANKRQVGVDKLAADVTGTQLGLMKDQAGWAREDRARYKEKFLPVEDKYIKEAGEWGSEANQAQAAAEAGADVQAGTAGARETARREAAAVGITPGSGRYAGVERAGEAVNALGMAGAQNAARGQRRKEGMAMQADVVNLGRGLPAQAAAGASGAVGAGSSAYNVAGANQQLSMQPSQIQMQGYAGAQQGYAGQAATLSNLYGMQLQKYQIEQENKSANMSGILNAVGTVAGMAFASDPKVKKNVKSSKKGSGLKAVNKMPIKKFDYKPGQGDGGKGHVGPMSTSFAKATGGQDTGQIRVQDAIGITMKAVQDLDAKVEKLSAKGSSKKTKAKKSKSSKPKKAANTNKPKGPRGPSKPMVKPVKSVGIGVSLGLKKAA